MNSKPRAAAIRHDPLFWILAVLLISLAISLLWPAKPAGAADDPPEPMPRPLLLEKQAPLSGDHLEAVPTYEDTLVELVNQERWNNGQLPPLKRIMELDSAAETHSLNQALRNFFGHCDLDTGSWPDDRMRDAGYFPNGWGENIAAGYGSPSSVMSAWMGSSGHRANILSSSNREIGVGYYYQQQDGAGIRQDFNTDCRSDGNSNWPYYHYWTQVFGRRTNIYPLVIDREAFQTYTRSVNLYMYGAGWAQEMRFCNAGRLWSDWESYNPTKVWNLAGGNGPQTVLAEIRNGGTVLSTHDTIWLEEAAVHWSVSDSKPIYLPFVAKPLVLGEYCGVP